MPYGSTSSSLNLSDFAQRGNQKGSPRAIAGRSRMIMVTSVLSGILLAISGIF